MSIAAKLIGLFVALEKHHIDVLAPNTRKRFAQFARHWADYADPPINSLPAKPPKVPKSGILADLRDGLPRHE